MDWKQKRADACYYQVFLDHKNYLQDGKGVLKMAIIKMDPGVEIYVVKGTTMKEPTEPVFEGPL